jgi:hypothetical protein
MALGTAPVAFPRQQLAERKSRCGIKGRQALRLFERSARVIALA